MATFCEGCSADMGWELSWDTTSDILLGRLE